ncbi:MAG TPA: tRNA lysidine(34) synthetase TilS, partial [Stellaceae bacterium]|nr:tRNA lysidine(34) synthetase TilS [Stellaceae bacterium]
GCRFVHWRGRVLVLRELAHAAPPVRLAPGTGRLWDRRFAVALPPAAGEPVTIGYLGAAGARELDRRIGRPRHTPLPRLIYPVLPAVRDDRGLLCVPHLGYRREGAPFPVLLFRPVNPLTTAGFTIV